MTEEVRLKTLSIDELEIGMFVTTVMLKHSKTKVKNQGRVNSQSTIMSLKKQGVTQVIIKLESDKEQNKNLTAKEEKLSTAESVILPCSLNEEFSRSCEIYDDSNKKIQDLFDQAKSQKNLSPQAISLLASEITNSVIRNQYAITILTRIRHHSTYQWEHATNCAILVCGFALFLGLNKETAEKMTLGALLHDIGVAKIPKGIIEKPDKLTVNEMDIVKKHLAWGHQLCKKDGFNDPIIMDMLINHHERLDGSGYPRGLKKEKLSKLARITAIIDVYDAVTGDKAYKKGQQPINALRYLLAEKGKFDQQLVQQFIKYLGVHPVGSLVKLSNDKIAIVVEGNRADPLKPKVKIFYSLKLQNYINSKDCDLSLVTITIVGSARAEDYNINIAKVIHDIANKA
ncbi:HD-GYP domain-containing protein [Colwellia sp. BRX9-1]|uniref:HD-GYP domain-containing protein n=1 Tax=Colwellia sp. BRX9-1 TaxID=2759830 RepID=UPI0015F6E63E|nr:HD-GYP domain-containing protein [Colwellia sp. BRX9-1]MBA6353849.1 HD-GYP domain-containing protein [Colwellia sp. BRX9-1]